MVYRRVETYDSSTDDRLPVDPLPRRSAPMSTETIPSTTNKRNERRKLQAVAATRLSPAEYRIVQKRAEREGVSVSTLIRSLLLEQTA